MAYTPTVVFDFDGVIHSYAHGWQGAENVTDPVVPGIKEAISQLSELGYKVVVVSTRCTSAAGMGAVRKYLRDNDIRVDDVMAEKPPAMCYIDDRAICFRGNAGKLVDQVKNFKSWIEAPELQTKDCAEVRMKELTPEQQEAVRLLLKNQRMVVAEQKPSSEKCLRPCTATVYDLGRQRDVVGYFHRWGTNYEEFETGPGNFTTAIIETFDGSVVSCPAETVRFLDRGEPKE